MASYHITAKELRDWLTDLPKEADDCTVLLTEYDGKIAHNKCLEINYQDQYGKMQTTIEIA